MIAVDGGEVWADDSGGDGPPLVLLHPGVGDSRIWEPVLPALTAEVMEQLRSGARAEISSGDMQQEDPPVYGRLGEISVPASLLVGDADYPPLIQANREAAARVRNCELIVAPGMDHLPPLREPGLVLRAITSTLARAGRTQVTSAPSAPAVRVRRASRNVMKPRIQCASWRSESGVSVRWARRRPGARKRPPAPSGHPCPVCAGPFFRLLRGHEPFQR